MGVRIRLARFGCRNRPFYRLMAADSKSLRDGRHLEVLGYYDPLPGEDGGKRMGLKAERIKYWLSVGAQPSEPVLRILRRAGILPLSPVGATTRNGVAQDAIPADAMSGHLLTPESCQAADQLDPPQSFPLCLSVPLADSMDGDLQTGPNF